MLIVGVSPNRGSWFPKKKYLVDWGQSKEMHQCMAAIIPTRNAPKELQEATRGHQISHLWRTGTDARWRLKT